MRDEKQASTVPCPSLGELIEWLEGLSGPADLGELKGRMQALGVGREDLGEFVRFRDERYRRNEIATGDWYELLALCWKSGQASTIHDHKGSGCVFLVVEGPVTEVVYRHTPSGLVLPERENTYQPGQVCASWDEDTHMLANANPPGTDMITLHCYTPRLDGIRVYDPLSTTVSVFEG